MQDRVYTRFMDVEKKPKKLAIIDRSSKLETTTRQAVRRRGDYCG
jgi:hypothetical protein